MVWPGAGYSCRSFHLALPRPAAVRRGGRKGFLSVGGKIGGCGRADQPRRKIRERT